MIVNCKNCEKSLDNLKNKFCNKSCANSYNNRVKPKRKMKIRKCRDCGSDYTHKDRRSIYCNDCFDMKHSLKALKAKTLKEIQNKSSVKGRHRSWINSEVRNFNRTWNKSLSKLPCANCGYSLHVELCHVKAITDFPETASLGEINDPSNVIQLCRNCHWEFDNGHLVL